MSYIGTLAAAIRREVPPDAIPPDSADLFLVYAALAMAKGESVVSADVHDAWVAWMELHGKRHPSMVPFNELPEDVQREDSPFVLAIRRAVKNAKMA